MSDFRNDPNFRNDPSFERQAIDNFDPRVQWASVAVILLLVGGLIVAASYTGDETQVANNGATVETTGSGSMGSAATMDKPPPQLRR